jgi:hypothetical protein
VIRQLKLHRSTHTQRAFVATLGTTTEVDVDVEEQLRHATKREPDSGRSDEEK